MAIIAGLSKAFSYGTVVSEGSTMIVVGLLIFSGALYVTAFVLITGLRQSKATLLVCLALGFIARLSLFGSTPVHEDDWYRYLWDGAVLNEGISPYTFPPADAFLNNAFGDPITASDNAETNKLRALGAKTEHWPDRINYPYLATIYPPLAQIAFALANHIAPFNLDAWRFVLLLHDAAGLAIMVFFLRIVNYNPFWVLAYWWNPLAIFTSYNTAHMDALLVPYICGAICLAAMNRPRFSALAIAGAAAIKLWPIILAPILLRSSMRDWLAIGTILCVATVLFLSPMFLQINAENSGLIAFASDWQKNAFLFPRISSALDLVTDNSDQIARFVSAAIPLGFIAWATFNENLITVPRALLIAVTLFFLTSPTGYPWYAIWFFTMLPFAPSVWVASFAVTLPLYYLRFSLEAIDQGDYFNTVLVPIEFLFPAVFGLSLAAIRRIKLQ